MGFASSAAWPQPTTVPSSRNARERESVAAIATTLVKSAVSRNIPGARPDRGPRPAFGFAGHVGSALPSPRMWALLKEFLQFLRQEKKWWMVPLVLVLVGLAALLIFGSSSGIAWALYPFM